MVLTSDVRRKMGKKQKPTYNELEHRVADLEKENAVLHKTQQRLAEVGSFAGTVIEQVADGLCVWYETPDYPYIRVTVWNEKMEEITGYTKGEINRDGWYRTMYREPGIEAKVKRRLERMWQGEDLVAEEWEVIRKDGTRRAVQVSASPIEGDGEFPHALASMHDVSETKWAADALQESEERFRTIAETVRDVFWLRLSDRMLYVNPAYERLWGRSRQSLYEDPSSFLEAVHPEDRERVRAAMGNEWNKDDGCFDEKYRIVQPDGTVRWIHARSFPVESEDCSNKTVGIARDVTEIENSKEALREARDELEMQVRQRTAELNNRRKELETANRRLYRENAKRRRLSEKLVDLIERERHEICMSLHENMAQSMAILGIQLDYVQGKLAREQKDLAQTIEKAKVLVGTVIDDMKRLSQGIGSDVLTHLGLVPALRSLMENVDHGIETELSLSDSVEERINLRKRLALFRVAQEALTNVEKHAGASRVHLNLVGGEKKVRLTIEDNGAGFDPGRVRAVSHGLLLMEERTEQCGGELTVESDANRGTLVMAKIPVD